MCLRAIRPCLEGWLSHMEQATGLAVRTTDHRCGTVSESHRLRCVPHVPAIAGSATLTQATPSRDGRRDQDRDLARADMCLRNETRDRQCA